MIANVLTNPLPVAPAPAPAGAPQASKDGKEASPFARLLDDAAPPTEKTSGTRATSTNKVPLGKERLKERVDKGSAPVDPAIKQTGPTVPPVECPAEAVATAPEQAEETDAATATTATDAAALLATLPPLPQRPYPAGNTGPVRSPAGGNPQPGGGVRNAGHETDPVLTPPDLGDTRDTRNAARAEAGTAFAETLREVKATATEAQPAHEQTALPLAAQAPTATAVSASAPAEARIAATPGSADFASQLGAQLSIFVKDGIEHAKLELHPVELGPVTVQIQIDGGNAQVNLAAEQAPTRAALEDALPQLAGSLREAGLTLTGGGVFEQPRQPDQPPADRSDGSVRSNPRSERDSAGRESITTQPLSAPRRRGVVDLVA